MSMITGYPTPLPSLASLAAQSVCGKDLGNSEKNDHTSGKVNLRAPETETFGSKAGVILRDVAKFAANASVVAMGAGAGYKLAGIPGLIGGGLGAALAVAGSDKDCYYAGVADNLKTQGVGDTLTMGVIDTVAWVLPAALAAIFIGGGMEAVSGIRHSSDANSFAAAILTAGAVGGFTHGLQDNGQWLRDAVNEANGF